MLRKALFIFLILATTVLISAGFFLEQLNRPPRELAPYIERRAAGHNPTIVGFGNWLGKNLRLLDRMDGIVFTPSMLRSGARVNVANTNSGLSSYNKNLILVSSAEQARAAINNAKPGDVITFLPGHYAFSGGSIIADKAGLADAPITIRATQLGSVNLAFSLTEGLLVSAPYWIVENLVINGVCKVQSNCEHAFHIVQNAHHFVARNNIILDFNAHIKVNKAGDQTPDDGVIERNSISNTEARHTEHSVTLIDLVAASRWRIQYNLITDFVKDGSDKISYGAFVKGGGSDNRIENNVVICEHLLRGQPGQRVGLSLGGGGTGKAFCRDHRCITEQDRGVIASNLVLACSDDGIYLNKAAASHIMNNTLIDTGGIEVRFPESTADVEGNLVDGKIRARDGGLLRERDNMDTAMVSLFLGYHPVRNLFNHPSSMDFSWRQKPAKMSNTTAVSQDLCGAKRNAESLIGAFDDFRPCLSSGINIPK
jgi:hypothetical protein